MTNSVSLMPRHHLLCGIGGCAWSRVTQGLLDRSPEESKARIVQHLGMLCPDAFDDDLEKLIR